MATTEETLTMLRRISEQRNIGYRTKLSVKNDWAGLEIFSADGDAGAVVYSPGDRWVSLEVPGPFSTNYFEEGITDEDLLIWLERYLDAAIAYQQGQYVLRRSKRLRIPHVVIETSTETIRLELTLKALIRAVVTRGRTA